MLRNNLLKLIHNLTNVLFIDGSKLNFKIFFSSFALGVKFALAPDATLRAKVNNSSQIGLSYQQKLRDGEGLFFFKCFLLLLLYLTDPV